MMTREEAEKKLKKIFGIDHFYDEQWEVIERILNGERVLLIERTGFGKSLCYQFPATQFPGLTVVFSPLIALMRDQVEGLCRKGIPAALINSEQNQEESDAVIEDAKAGKFKLLYIAPERQENQKWREAVDWINLSMVVIDEAHTISTWGHDFRPSFKKIVDLVNLLPKNLPVLATTATATKRVQKDIEEQIANISEPIRGSLIRPNFQLQVIRVNSEEEKMIWIAENLKQIPGTGIIYTGTRDNTKSYTKWLKFVGINAAEYNAGLDAYNRKEIENGLMINQWKCIVSTNALGMGIDKPDIRFIIHTQIPASPIHYYQEIGRAGRDGKPTRCILFYNESKDQDGIAADNHLPMAFIENARPKINKYHQVIELLKIEPLSEKEILKRANLKLEQIKVIKADLIERGIVKMVDDGKKKIFEYQYDAPELDAKEFDALRESKAEDLEAMVGYVYTKKPRMEYLCHFLDSDESVEYTNCDNTNLPQIKVEHNPALIEKLEKFKNTDFPVIALADSTTSNKWEVKIPRPGEILVTNKKGFVRTYRGQINLEDIKGEDRETVKKIWEKHQNKSRIVDGYASSNYGVSNVGSAIHRCKYENGGDFPEFLLERTLSAFEMNFGNIPIDLVLYVPPTSSGDLVRNFAVKFASAINAPISHGLLKIKETEEQKIFQNREGKKDNVANAFDIDESTVRNKTIVLIDDIYDSGATLKEIGKLLTRRGAELIIPMVIAKAVSRTE